MVVFDEEEDLSAVGDRVEEEEGENVAVATVVVGIEVDAGSKEVKVDDAEEDTLDVVSDAAVTLK
jgi:hypothetical protein